jgi:hypothetical protein
MGDLRNSPKKTDVLRLRSAVWKPNPAAAHQVDRPAASSLTAAADNHDGPLRESACLIARTPAMT